MASYRFFTLLPKMKEKEMRMEPKVTHRLCRLICTWRAVKIKELKNTLPCILSEIRFKIDPDACGAKAKAGRIIL